MCSGHRRSTASVFTARLRLHTAAIFFLYCLGLLATQPQCSPTRLVLSESTGGTLSRWLLPFALLAPPVLGWLFQARRKPWVLIMMSSAGRFIRLLPAWGPSD